MQPDLTQMFSQAVGNAQESAKTFKDLLKERRMFVQSNEDKAFGDTRNSIQNGARGGVPINPVEALDSFLNFSTKNSNTTAQMAQEANSMNDQSMQALQALTSYLGGEKDRALREKELNLQYGLDDGSGTDNGTGSGTTMIDQAVKDVVSGTRQLTDIPKGLQGKVSAKLTEMGYEPDPLAAQKRNAQSVIGNLEKIFGRGDAANVGTEKDLSLANGGNILEKLAALTRGTASPVFEPGLKQDQQAWESAINNVTGVVSQALGSGTPQEAEAKRLIENAPKFGSSDKEVKAWFENMRNLLATPEMKIEAKKKAALGKTEKPSVNGYVIEKIE